MFQKIIRDLSETDNFAVNFIKVLLPAVLQEGVQIALEGELGSGKTSFVASVVKALHYDQHVSSPTYVLENQYICPNNILVRHWDLYRIPLGSTPDELFEPLQPKELRLIEWASRAPELSVLFDLKLDLKIVSEFERFFSLDLLASGKNKKLQLNCFN